MLFGWFLLMGLAALALWGWRAIVELNRAVTSREVVARRLGLHLIREHEVALRPPDLKGVASGQEVWVRYERQPRPSGLGYNVKTVVSAPNVCLPTSLQVRGRQGIQGLWLGLRRLVGADALSSRDPVFDEVAQVNGSLTMAAALLSAEARTLIIHALAEHPLEVMDGAVKIEHPGPTTDPDTLEAMIRTVAEIAHALSLRTTIQTRLADNATLDPCADVRLHCFNLLIQSTPTDDQNTIATARTCLLDPDPRLRLAAATRLGVEGFGDLTALALDPSVAAEMRAEALDTLAFRAPPKVLKAALRGALSTSEPRLVAAAARAAARCQDRDAFGDLTKHLRRHDPTTDAAIARALGRLGDVPAQPLLVALLSDHNPDAVRAAALESLGFIGTPDEVRALKPLCDGPLKQAARAAIQAIQARAGGAQSSGALALAADTQEAPSGALSLSEHPPQGGLLMSRPAGKAKPGDTS